MKFFVALLLAVTVASSAFAVEVSPEIGLHHRNLNGTTDPSSEYQSKAQKHDDALNNRVFRNGQISNTVPDVDSVGLNFTFKLG